MPFSGQSFARSARLVAWTITASFSVLAASPGIGFAQDAQTPPIAPPVPSPAGPAPAVPAPPPMPTPTPNGTVMTLDQAAPVMTPMPAPPGQGIIRRIIVQGTQRIEPDSVLSYMVLREGQPYDPAGADRSLKALFDTGLFADVRMTWDGMVLTVRVVENPILNQVVYEGNSKLSDADLNKEVQVRPRMVFTRARVQADVQRIIELYRRAGRFSATVEPEIIQRPQNRVDLVFEINEGPTTGVAAINFIGNRVFDDSDLRSQIATTTSAWWKFLSTNDNYDPDRLTFDREQLRRYYLSHGYADFRVVSAVAELAPDRRNFYITFTLDEGQLYHFGKISIESQIRDLNPNDLKPLLTTNQGDVYDAEQIDSSIDALTFAAGTKGFVFIDIRPRVTRNPDTRTIDLIYEIDQAPRVYIERINIVGNTRTRDEVIRREFRLAEGDAFNRVLADRSRTRVRALGFFSDVTIKEDPGSAPDRTVLTVNVTEQPTGELSLGAGFSSQQGLLVDFSYTERNLFGRGQFVRTSVSIGSYQKDYDFRFTEPYFLGRPLAAGFLAYKIITDYSQYIGYISDVTAAGIQFGFPISEFGRLSPHYNFSYTSISAVGSASLAILLAQGHYSASSVGYTYTYDTRDDPILPTKGWNFAFSQDIAGLSGDLKYLRTVVGLEYYHPFFFGLVGEVAFNGGYVSAYGGQTIPINERFYKGGPSFRGFQIAGIGPREILSNSAVGGQLFAIGTYQVRLPDFLPPDYGIKLSVFTDFGTLGVVRGQSTACTQFSCVRDDLAPRGTVGLAVNWKSPFGPVEIDFAVPYLKQSYDKPQAIRFSAGTNF
jgi:outer membrane protein insertion porin family